MCLRVQGQRKKRASRAAAEAARDVGTPIYIFPRRQGRADIKQHYIEAACLLALSVFLCCAVLFCAVLVFSRLNLRALFPFLFQPDVTLAMAVTGCDWLACRRPKRKREVLSTKEKRARIQVGACVDADK